MRPKIGTTDFELLFGPGPPSLGIGLSAVVGGGGINLSLIIWKVKHILAAFKHLFLEYSAIC